MLRPANEIDVELLTNISTQAFHSDVLIGGDPNDGPPDYDSVDWHKRMYEENHLYSLEVDGVIVGGAVIFYYGDVLYVGRIFVSPRYFKKGYGMMIMSELERLFPDVKTFKLDTPVWNARTNNLYIKCGYKEIGRNSEEISYQKVK